MDVPHQKIRTKNWLENALRKIKIQIQKIFPAPIGTARAGDFDYNYPIF